MLSTDKLVTQNDVLPKTSESVWESISNEFVLDHQTQSSKVQAEIRRLVADQDRFYKILDAAAPYIYFIHQQTRARGLPAELALIPFIESEFNPYDRSSKGAAGLWQLMSGTANDLGVKIKSGYDGRRNIISSTRAALSYFKDLNNNFNGDWYLAIAAYNCGPMKVTSAQRRTGEDSFWNLPLPLETKYYVPRLLAVAEIIENPDKYGIALPPIINKPYFTELKVNKAASLQKIAKSSGINIKTLNKLNPDYKRGVVTKNGSLLVPINTVATVKEKLLATK
ncbi:MAG: Membrane bound lytic murein transglycosylase D [uncultured bacterium]|nr:MAG: Membrane bound lytic murein transglycosylase D [uncultured bacterium]